MLQNVKLLIVSLLSAGTLMFAFAAPVAAQTTGIEENIRDGICATDAEECGGEGADARGTITGIVRKVIDIFSLVVGVVSVIMIIIGGLKYITSAGESSNVSSAKNTILYALIGLVIVALAQAIVLFVFDQATV